MFLSRLDYVVEEFRRCLKDLSGCVGWPSGLPDGIQFFLVLACANPVRLTQICFIGRPHDHAPVIDPTRFRIKLDIPYL